MAELRKRPPESRSTSYSGATTAGSTGDDRRSELFSQNVKDMFFDYDSYDISAQIPAGAAGGRAASCNSIPTCSFTVEGHCDERGSTEYNLALGDNRANAANNALVRLGVPADRIQTISYGKEKPFCTESTNSAGNRTGAPT